LLFLAGLEIEPDRLRGRTLRLSALGFAVSVAIALLVSLALSAGGLVQTPLLVAIVLCATSLGVLIPVLKDAGEISTTFGQLIVAAATIADFGAIACCRCSSPARAAPVPRCCCSASCWRSPSPPG
jgi:Kef-type K+ transport system membrane component KefB